MSSCNQCMVIHVLCKQKFNGKAIYDFLLHYFHFCNVCTLIYIYIDMYMNIFSGNFGFSTMDEALEPEARPHGSSSANPEEPEAELVDKSLAALLFSVMPPAEVMVVDKSPAVSTTSEAEVVDKSSTGSMTPKVEVVDKSPAHGFVRPTPKKKLPLGPLAAKRSAERCGATSKAPATAATTAGEAAMPKSSGQGCLVSSRLIL